MRIRVTAAASKRGGDVLGKRSLGTKAMSKSELIQRLDSLRSKIRRRLVGYGVCAVASGGVWAYLTIVLLDWLLWFPPVLRLIVAALFVGGFVLATWHWVVRPLRARVERAEIAARLEHYFSPLFDRLSSAVSFAEKPDAGSPTMMHQVVSDTEGLLRGLPLESALSLRPLTARATSLATAGTVLALVAWLGPQWLHTGAGRYLDPFGSIEWPRRTRIAPLTGDLAVAVGESLTLRAAIERGDHASLRGVVRLREPDGQALSLTMQRDTDGTLYANVDAVTKDLQYWFEAGDDSTEANPSTVRVVLRPAVLQAIAVVEPPPYAPRRAESTHDLTGGPVNATVGGSVRIMIRASKPIPPDPGGERLGLRTEAGQLLPISVTSSDPLELSATLAVTEDLRLRPELRDEEGFENRGAATYEIRAVPDAPPTVTVLEPPPLAEATPRGAVRIVARISDDFGLKEVALHAETAAGRVPLDVPLTAHLRDVSADSGVEGSVEYRWSLDSLGLAPRDTVEYVVTATDTCTAKEPGGQRGHSGPMRISILGEAEFDTRLRSELAVLEARVRQVALEQADFLDRTQALRAPAESETGLSEVQRQTAGSVSGGEVRLTRRVRELAVRFQKVSERLEGGDSADPESRNRLLSIARALREVADDAMADAGAALSRSAAAATSDAQSKSIRDAIRHEERAVERLQGLIRAMAQWGNFQGLLAKAADLLDRQSVLRDETAVLGKQVLGKSLDALTSTEAASLKRIQRRQEQLAADVTQFLERMAQLRASSQEKDPSAGEAIEAALRAARTHELSQRLQDAVEAIRGNRTAAATIEQKSAADALRKMASSLREREERELAQLQKRLQQTEDQLALLIRDQEALRTASNEAGLVAADAEAYARLDDEQGRIRRNTTSLAEEIGQAERTAQVARDVRQAAAPMKEAEAQLRAQRASPAVAAQDLALGALREAVDRLARLAQDAANESMRRSLTQIREDLQALRAAQVEINQGLARLSTAIAGKDRMERAQTREASNLAREQAAARTQADAIAPDLDKVVVYRWAMERVTRWMDAARQAFEARRLDRDLVATTDRIVTELDKLIRALLETEALPPTTDFVESESGGEGSADAQGGKSVPTVAELLVLRGMQADVNERTRRHSGSGGPDPTEETLGQLKAIGEDQAEVKRLTELVTNRARQP